MSEKKLTWSCFDFWKLPHDEKPSKRRSADDSFEKHSSFLDSSSETRDGLRRLWKDIKGTGEPRMVISIPRFSYTLNTDKFKAELLSEAFNDVIRKSERKILLLCNSI